MTKTGIGALELVEKLETQVEGVELTKRGVVQVKQGLSVTHDERRRMFVISVAIGEKSLSLELRDIENVVAFVAGAA